MRLITFRKNGVPRAGVIAGDHAIDLADAAPDLGCAGVLASIRGILAGGDAALDLVRRIERAAVKVLRAGDAASSRWAIPLAETDLAPPIPDPEKIICIGQNYIDHCREQGVEPPRSPILFPKFATTLTGPNGTVVLPPEEVTTMVDYEVELAFVIGREAKLVTRAEAMRHVAGYMVLNDITARDVQKSDGQWTRAKSFDTFGPCGPWLVTTDEVPDPGNLGIWLRLNGEMMQNSSTSNLIFNIPHLIEYISRGMTLRPGDIISTGTPPGVGIWRKPPIVLKDGDEMEAGIEGIGTICNRVAR